MQEILKELNMVQEPDITTEAAATIPCHTDDQNSTAFITTRTTTTTSLTRIRRHDKKIGWTLLPMYLSHDLQATDLGHILQDALERARRLLLLHIDDKHDNYCSPRMDDDDDDHHHSHDPDSMNHDNNYHDRKKSRNNNNNNNNSLGGSSVVFLGMDAPELPLPDIVAALTQELDGDSPLLSLSSSSYYSTTRSLMCPADDGGYGMLSLPPAAMAHHVFQGVLWSHPLTAVSQLKALTDQHQHNDESDSPRPQLSVTLGQLMYDIDEPANVHALCQRLLQQQLQPPPSPSSSQQNAIGGNGDTPHSLRNNLVLDQPSSMAVLQQQRQNQDPLRRVQSHHPNCYYTQQALVDLGVIVENE
jgi:glycosyltransferase A (GT-A) superfamily protein (DUF2064 family)